MSVCLKTAGILPYNKNPLYQRQKDDDNILYGLHYDASGSFLLFCGFSLKSVVYIFMISLVTLVLVKVTYSRPFVII